MFETLILERVEQYLKTNSVPLVLTSGTVLKNKHCSTRSDEWNNA